MCSARVTATSPYCVSITELLLFSSFPLILCLIVRNCLARKCCFRQCNLVEHDHLPQAKEGSMAKIRHIAIATQNEEETAKFYMDVFGLRQVGKINIPAVSGYFLTDGDINVAILH